MPYDRRFDCLQSSAANKSAVTIDWP